MRMGHHCNRNRAALLSGHGAGRGDEREGSTGPSERQNTSGTRRSQRWTNCWRAGDMPD